MAKTSSQFVCQQCGAMSPRWMGQCSNCGVWNSFVETIVSKSTGGTKSMRSTRSTGGRTPVRLSEIKPAEYSKRTSTTIGELDRVLGGGIIPGMVTLLAGEPGIGKSTLLLQIADKLKGAVLYIAGEESSLQIANRAQRLGVKGEIEVLEETDVDAALGMLEVGRQWRASPSAGGGKLDNEVGSWKLIIVDSIQTLTTEDLAGTAGSVGQVRECTSRIVSFAKRTGTPVFIVGHVTKEGSIAGPRVLEHMVDAVLWFEGERNNTLRIVRAVKNRFGPTDEVGVFAMEEKGLIEVANPSQLFLSPTTGSGQAGYVPGQVVTSIMEGTRPILAEIEALVVPTKLAFPKRAASGVDVRRLDILIAVLQRRCGLPLWDHDIFVNASGGLRVGEPGADLAIALAIASSFYDKPLKVNSFAVGEVSLLGGIRQVPQLDKRVKEAKRLGYANSITSKEAKSLAQAIQRFLPKS